MNISEVYNNISREFDSSRYSVWKGVKEFLNSLPTKSSLCEAGCGNGKNLLYRSDLITKGYDISREMVTICQTKGLDTEEADITDLKIDNNSFDNVISIAVIHHLSTQAERIKAISELLRISRNRVLIYIWAYEQPENSRRKFKKGDNLVPFMTKNGEIYNRFYYVYKEHELEYELSEVKKQYNIDFVIENIYWELGNWCAILNKKY